LSGRENWTSLNPSCSHRGLQVRKSTIVQEAEGVMNTEPRPRAPRKRIVVAVRILLVVAGIASVSIGVAGLLGLVVMDGMLAIGMVVLGAAWLLGAIFRANIIEFVV